MAARKAVALIVLVGVLANVRAALVDKVSYMTSSTGAACKPPGTATDCDGGLERDFTTTPAATNVIPQVLNVKLMYTGTLPAASYVSLVDRTLNGGSPCTMQPYAAATPDSMHSGQRQANAQKVVEVQHSVLLDASKEFEFCFSPTTGSNAGSASAAWQGSGIYLKVSKIEYIKIYGRNFKTQGTIPHHASLTVRYSGTVLSGRWISMVDATLNTNNPCAGGEIAASPLDAAHSGSLKASAGTSTFIANTAALSATKLFAVCYAESGGITSSQWRDSGIRVFRSAITKTEYGVDTSRFGDGFVRSSWNRNTDDFNGIATDMFPQIAGSKLRYVGELADGKKISLVDQTLGGGLTGPGPCLYPSIAAGAASTARSGAITASNKIATIPQTTLLDAGSVASPKVYAVCYATGDGSATDTTWADSYVRYKLTKVEALTHHSVLHVTTGTLPLTGDVAAEKLKLAYIGSLGLGSGLIKFTLAKADSNPTISNPTPTGVQTPEPCASTSNAELANASPQAGEYSGVLATVTNKKLFELKTTDLKTGTIVTSPQYGLTEFVFAVCYSENPTNGYRDSGIRLTVGKIKSIRHGGHGNGDSSVLLKRLMKPVETTGAGPNFASLPIRWRNDANNVEGLSPGLASSRNVIPQAADQTITWDSTSDARTGMTKLYMSLVNSELNGNKPCAIGSVAAATADTQHSGAVRFTDSSPSPTPATFLASHFSIPQAVPLDYTKVFAVCYALVDGNTADATWADTYVRVTVSAVQSITSIGVQHRVSQYDGQIASRSTTTDASKDAGSLNQVTGAAAHHAAKLDLTYGGSLAAASRLSVVVETNNDGFPCGTGYRHGYQTVGNGPQASASTAASGAITATASTALVDTKSLAMGTYAICYSLATGADWYDTGIRVTRSPIYSMQYSSGYANYVRDQTSIFLSTNRIPSKVAVKLTYVDDNEQNGEIGNDAWISLVSDHLGAGNPCILESITEAAADGLHTGPVQGRDAAGSGSGKIATIPADSNNLDVDRTFAVCYTTSTPASGAGTVWKDSYVRLKPSQISTMQIAHGKWKGGCKSGQAGCQQASVLPGRTDNALTITGHQLVHKTIGQLPQMDANQEGLELTYTGSLAAGAYVTLVDASLGASTVHGIPYTAPCTRAGDATVPSTQTTGVHQGDGKGFCLKFSVAGSEANGCDNDGDGTYNEQCALGSRCNPTAHTNGGCGTAGVCSGAQFTSMSTTGLSTDALYALCYTKTATATTAITLSPSTTWLDSGVRLTVSKIRQLLTSSRHPGIAARIQTSIFAPTNRIPASPNMKMTYVGALAGQALISLVDAENSGLTTGGTLAGVANDKNPCVQTTVANKAESTQSSGAATATADKIFTITQASAKLLSSKTFAVCYAQSGNTLWWMDSGIRLGVTDIEALRVWGIDTVTTGQIANSPANFNFEYVGNLPAQQTIAFVDETLNSAFPCGFNGATAMASTTPTTTAQKLQYSGAKTAPAAKRVTNMDTTKLGTTNVFAICYASAGGGAGDASWADSGIRVTVPKVWNVQTSSGYTGPNCAIQTMSGTTEGGVLNTGCKLDTKPKDMTSKPDNTNRIAQVAGEQLTYVGTLGSAKYISLVSHMLNTVALRGPDSTVGGITPGPTPTPHGDTSTSGYQVGGSTQIGNPCANPLEAAANPDASHSGPVQASGNTVTFTTTANLNPTLTYAVCYAEGDGTTGDVTWKDSFIRLQITKINKIEVNLPLVNNAGTHYTSSIPIRTVGQLPSQEASKQVNYKYFGSMQASKFISLVLSTVTPLEDDITKWQIQNPCRRQGVAGSAGPGSSSSVGDQANAQNIFNVDTTGLTKSHQTFYALCYTEGAGGTGDVTWADSGIRLTVSEVDSMDYLGTNGDVITERRRFMTSIHLATNKLPHSASSYPLSYTGQLATNSFISIAAITSANSYNPCVNPTETTTPVASGGFSTQSGSLTASTRTVTVGVKFNDAYMYAVCYGKSGGVNTWRDSYIRLSVSKIASLKSYGIEHLTTGQLPNHGELKVDYAGTLPAGSHVVLVDARLGVAAMGSGSYPTPCAYAAQTMSYSVTDTARTPVAMASGNTVTLNTVDLKTQDTTYKMIYWNQWPIHGDDGVDTTEVYYAACYSEGSAQDVSAQTATFADSGIRLTVPEIVNAQYDSGYSTSQTVCTKFGGSLTSAVLCDATYSNTYNGQCSLGVPCNPANAGNGGCGTAGKCAYQEICTAVGGTFRTGQNKCDTNRDGVFDEACQVNSLCESEPSQVEGGCGSQGVCARQGTPVRIHSSWEQTDGNTLVERPTAKLAQVTNEVLFMQKHWTAQIGATGYFSLIDASKNNNNPCVLKSIANANTAANDATIRIQASGNNIQVAQSVLLSTAMVFAVCYSKVLPTNLAGSLPGTDHPWRDSYIRLKITKVKSLIVAGVTHVTTGQIPNVVSADGMRFTYTGTLVVAKHLSLVDDTRNSGLPCNTGAEAGATPSGFTHAVLNAWSKKTTHSGVHTAVNTKSYATSFDTTYMDTSKTFAVCYAEGTGATNDATWADSGIRVTLPKVYNVQYSSGVTGPTPNNNADTFDGVCRPPFTTGTCSEKQDTMPRSMTSNPLATNRFPEKGGEDLTYLGSLATNKYLSLIALDNPHLTGQVRYNPCVFPYLAAGARITGSQHTSGARQATGKTVNFQSWGAVGGYSKTKTFAVCYAENSGSNTDQTWRDSYIRVKMTAIARLDIKLPYINTRTSTGEVTFSSTLIKTVGQLPNQAASQQVNYDILCDNPSTGHSCHANNLLSDSYISLVDASSPASQLVEANDLPSAMTGFTGILNFDPCRTQLTADPPAAPPSPQQYSKKKQATTYTVKVLDTTELDPTKTFALCYAQANAATAFTDSGIRITVPKIHTLRYVGAGNSGANGVITARKRDMTSVYFATNILPAIQSTPGVGQLMGELEYLGYTGVGNALKIALVGIDDGSNGVGASNSVAVNPCVNPAIAGGSASTTHSGMRTAAAKKFDIPQGSLLQSDYTLTACYSDGDGSITDRGWRDSYIRLTVSKIGTITAAGVTHKTTGQIPSHPYLYMSFTGSFSALHATSGASTSGNGVITLVDATLGSVAMGNRQYPNPCATRTIAYKTPTEMASNAAKLTNAVGQSCASNPNMGSDTNSPVCASTAASGVWVDTSDLRSEQITQNWFGAQTSTLQGSDPPTPRGGDPRYFAVCFSEGASTSNFRDTGVRVSVPEIINMQAPSHATYGHYGSDKRTNDGTIAVAASGAGDGSPWRDQTSKYLPTNRLPKMAGQQLYAIWSASSNACLLQNRNADTTCTFGDSKYFSLVLATANGGDPCVLKSITEGTSQGTGQVQAATTGTSVNKKMATFDASGLNAGQQYAVCYSKGSSVWSDNPATWGTTPPASAGGTTAVPYWRDSYIRLKVTHIESLIVAGVTHRTYGQVPDVMATDMLDFAYTGVTATQATTTYLSLVDASVYGPDGEPCDLSKATGSWSSEGTGAKQSGHRKCIVMGGSPSASGCDTDNGGTFNDACVLNAKCASDASCGSGGICAPAVSSFQTHGLVTSAGESYIYVGDATGNNPKAVKGRYFAVCYLEASLNLWDDTGIRVTVSAVHSVRYSSGHPGSPDRDHTSLKLSTNRIPNVANVYLKYYGTLAAQKFVSLVDATLNNGNPCVRGIVAARAKDNVASGPLIGGCVHGQTAAQCAGNSAMQLANVNPSQVSGLVAYPSGWGDTKTVDVDASGLDVRPTGQNNAKVYAVCYDEGAGTTASLTWRDTYIRFELSEILHFGTKGVFHKTTGQIPRERAGIRYNYEGLGSLTRISLVDATQNALISQSGGFSRAIPQPCQHTVAATASGSGQTGPITLGQPAAKQLNTLETVTLNNAGTYALCYAAGVAGQADSGAAAGKWTDSGIRITISAVDSIFFSGYRKTIAEAIGKRERKIMSVLPALQTENDMPNGFTANVLPAMANMPLRYGGALAHGRWIALVEVSAPAAIGKAAAYSAAGSDPNGGFNPCVDAGKAAAAKSVGSSVARSQSGPLRGCSSGEDNCEFANHGDGSTSNMTKEVNVEIALNPEKMYTVCYADTRWSEGVTPRTSATLTYFQTSAWTTNTRTVESSGFPEWRDSYIRVTISDVSAIVASGVTHTDHGHIASHQWASELPVAIVGTGVNWLSLVDERLGDGTTGAAGKELAALSNDRNPCNNPATAAKAAPDTQHTGAVRVGTVILHKLSTLNDCGHTWSSNTPVTLPAAQGDAYRIAEPVSTWGCPPNPAGLAVWTISAPPADAGNYVVETPTSGVVRFDTSGLDTTKQFAVCYSKDAAMGKTAARTSAVWRDTGIRVTVTKVNTIRDNIAQLPILKTASGAAHATAVDTSKFARDFTSSRTRVGRHTCLNMGGTGIQSWCDVNGDGVYNEGCTLGAFCDPDRIQGDYYNGGCGAGTGLCGSGLGVRQKASVSLLAARWTRTIYNHQPHASQGMVHTLRRSGVNALGLDFFTSTPNVGGISTATPFFFSLVGTSQNNGEPCALPATASGTANSFRTAVYSATPASWKGGFTIPAADLASLDATDTYTVCYSTKTAPHVTAQNSAAASGSPTDAYWRDAYIRFKISDIDYIESHGIKHYTQAHIPSGEHVAITYSGTLGSGAFLYLVAETENRNDPCGQSLNGQTGIHYHPQQTRSYSMGAKQRVFDLRAADVEVNYAVCYSTSQSAATWLDSGIRATISRISKMYYNLKSTANINPCIPGASAWDTSSGRVPNCLISQQGTVDYQRPMPSKNIANGVSDTVPPATNRISASATEFDLVYYGNEGAVAPNTVDSSLPKGSWVTVVATSLNTDKNPCASQCDGDAACEWSTSDGVQKAQDTQRTGPAKATVISNVATSAVRIDQKGPAGSPKPVLSPTVEVYAVCYGQHQHVNAADGASFDKYTFRDSYVRLKPTKLTSFITYGIEHHTVGDIPAKPTLTFTLGGTLMTAGAYVSLVSATENNNQPCTVYNANQQLSHPLSAANQAKFTYRSRQIATCTSIGGTPSTNACDRNNDGIYSEECNQGARCDLRLDNPVAGNNYGCGSSGVCAYSTEKQLDTVALSTDLTFAVCYADNATLAWTDSGIRLQTPQVQAITYGAPARVIDSKACFDKVNLAGLKADCKRRLPSATAERTSNAHYSIGAILPRASNVEISYSGGLNGAAPAVNKYISLVEQEQVGAGAAGTAIQRLNPCRNAAEAARDPAVETGTQGSSGGHADDEGGMRLHSGAVQASSGSRTVVIPQRYDGGGSTVRNRLDYTKTFAVCYSTASGSDGSVTDANWRDSYIRVTLSKIKTLAMLHTGYPNSKVNITTIGTFANVPSLELQWDGSLLYDQYIKLTAASANTDAPCDQTMHAGTGLTTAVTTPTLRSLSASKRVTFDTASIANPNQVTGFFAVCYATDTGIQSDNTWRDSGIRLRFVRWSNPAKHRVVSGAPVRITFALSTGNFEQRYDKVSFLRGSTDCRNAPNAPEVSDGSAVKRTIDYVCTRVDGTAASNCDANFDGIFSEKCTVGARCGSGYTYTSGSPVGVRPNDNTNGGCGTGGICSAAVQLPTGKSYAEVQDTGHMNEVALAEGNYAVCVCLGSPLHGTGYAANQYGYGPANGDGHCSDGNEFTLISANTTGYTLKVISEPQLGRFTDADDRQTSLRHAAGMNHKYPIKTLHSTAGYGVANGDFIYFAPASHSCGTATRFSGAGTHTYDHNTNLYVSSGVDRRWRAISNHQCVTSGGTNIGNNCDANGDGVFAETCAQGTLCDISNGHNGGCGSTGSCGSLIPTANNAGFTAPIALTGYSGGAAMFVTPSNVYLSTPQTLKACFTTSESAAGFPHDVTDYVELTHTLQVVTTPRLGPIGQEGRVYAVENSSPSFLVNPWKDQDLMYFVPQLTQSLSAPAGGDCTPNVCTVVGGSNIGNNCDSDSDGVKNNRCEFMAVCDPTQQYNGGCGTSGTCTTVVPTVHTSKYTGLILGAGFSGTTGKISLPSSTQLAVPPVAGYPSAWYLAACWIPAGAVKDLPTNVKQLDDLLTVIKEPTDALMWSWFQNEVAELKFTQPQQGTFGVNMATGLPGDIVVLQRNNCVGVHDISTSTFTFTAGHSAKFTLEEAGNVIMGDEKGGTAKETPLAIGKVNELTPGIYQICYATAGSAGESQEDFKALARTLEIKPTPATQPSLSTPRSVILGQDIVVAWASNIGLQTTPSSDNSWLGLYPAGACTDTHDCYIAFQFIAASSQTGTVIFSQHDYKISGEYEVRYFDGASINGQGVVCGGQSGVPHETYLNCALRVKHTSDRINVLGQDIDNTEELSLSPGLEAVFGTGNRGRYHRTKLT